LTTLNSKEQVSKDVYILLSKFLLLIPFDFLPDADKNSLKFSTKDRRKELRCMRMWMLPPGRMCKKHLLGEHAETHMFLGSLLRAKRLGGFFEKKLLEPQSLFARHNELAAEMIRRGYNHKSSMNPEEVKQGLSALPAGQRSSRVNPNQSQLALSVRCEDCRKLLETEPK